MKNKKILLANSLLLLALLLFIEIPIKAIKLFKLHEPISGDISLLLSGAISVITLGGIALLYCRITKRKFTKVMVIKKISIKQVMLTMVVSIGTYIFAGGINSLSMKLFPVVIKDGMVISSLLNSSSLLVGLLVVVLVPAFFEEVFFRGIFLDAYEGINKKMKYFIITAIFATFHGNVMQIIYVLFLGFILLKVREYTGSLLGSMTLHAANNAISFIISKVAMSYMKLVDTGIENGVIDPAKAATTADAMNVSFTVALLRASIFFLIGGAILFINLRKLKEYKEEKEGLEYSQEEEYSQNLEYNEGEKYILREEKTITTDKKQYIPLAIYFVCMVILIVRRY
ncbi:CPBP family intramembrane metalloprotease [Clostridium tagluense]|uniref:CPBP family intramembrane glutamic endopeptidase n=1 Tax=Clostridium tagluense TaxID=360422 RepID=UPI001C0C43E1|nr:CPBP family intramembrane glutamic endopeptidase [Clostridium tagluense]MBU3129425.1 CPBP family intramembrane metalloprotease [Clostridium tagluense]MCB2310597.1 CPBP family intramembrane metalloprotease [Clostridium tagluense]MCB2315672.1 CPBP family intramembrane metalloprotease [Clostridium tagluense]MCB2320526.1 CPBP family intramembrane metalloprotease [Clostridium tagluense]MCB2325191.1 CPBP family intramembrane metalloprotease [Clostridium tagluense]